jgi:hypothetical protein
MAAALMPPGVSLRSSGAAPQRSEEAYSEEKFRPIQKDDTRSESNDPPNLLDLETGRAL